MKKYFRVLFALAVGFTLAFSAGDDDSIDFKVYLKPHQLYTQVLSTDSHMEMTFEGSPEFLQRMKDQGYPNPTVKDKKSKQTNISKTGDVGPDNKFPIVLIVDNQFKEVPDNDTSDKVHVFGKCELGKVPVVDSIAAPTLNEDTKKLALQMMQNIFTQMVMPERHLKIGDTFNIVQPLTIPFGKNTMVMNLTIQYTLKKIKKDMAYFTTRETYTVQMKVEDMPVTASGSGKGEYTYDIKGNYYKHSLLKDTLNMILKYEGFSMNAKSYISTGSDETVTGY